MPDRRVDAFFYGLFMDREVLDNFGIEVVNPRRAYAKDFALVIGNRATLVAMPKHRSYGMVMSVSHAEINQLYSGSGLKDYVPEALLVNLMSEQQLVPALCLNLLNPPNPDEINHEYAIKLKEALRRLEFPSEYIESIA